MKCPKCDGSMEKVHFDSIEVDRCTQCQGLWFDSLEVVELQELPGAEAIDTGDAGVGRHFNTLDRIPCPRCQGEGKMLRMVHPRQRHIWFEQCSVCGGAFFDAGEFRDLKSLTVADFFRDLLTRKRG